MELARELGGLLTGEGGLMVGKGGRGGKKGRGMIGLDEVWCAWNRARGVGESMEPFEVQKEGKKRTQN